MRELAEASQPRASASSADGLAAGKPPWNAAPRKASPPRSHMLARLAKLCRVLQQGFKNRPWLAGLLVQCNRNDPSGRMNEAYRWAV